MNKIKLMSYAFSIFMLFSLKSFSASKELINQVLFEVNKAPITTQDFKDYMAAKKNLKIQMLSPYVKNELQEFILFHVVLQQYVSLEQLPAVEVNSQNLVASINTVRDYLKTRDKQNNSADRFEIWFNLMKRKHHYISKVADLEK